MPAATESIVQMAAAACARHGDTGAFLCNGARLGFRELDGLSTAFACWLAQQGLHSGERVAVQLPNLLEYPVVALGVLKAGLVLVNVNPLYTAPELAHQLQDSGARILVTAVSGTHVAAQVVLDTGGHTVVVARGDGLHAFPERQFPEPASSSLSRCRFPRLIGLCAALHMGRRAHIRDPQLLAGRVPAPDALAVLQYTGGTTGPARAVMLSHRNLLSNVLQLGAALGGRKPLPGALMVAPLPLYHVYAFTTTFLGSLFWGAQVLLIPDPRDTATLASMLQGLKINAFVGVNTLFKALCGQPAFRQLDFSALRLCSAGGMPLAPEVAARWLELTGCAILEGYGLSECSPLVACSRYDALREGTVGQPVPGTELVLKTANGDMAAAGEPGEICVRGPQVMQGYWRQPQQSAAAFTPDGFLRTGDIGVFDSDGYLQVVDRLKDMLIVSGFKVYPHEIEEYVRRHPDVDDAAVVGTGDDSATRVKLFVVAGNPQLTAEAVIAWCRQGLAPYKVPKQVEFRNALPRSSFGKVLRRELRGVAATGEKISV